MLKVRYTEWPPWAMDVPAGNKTELDGVLKDVFEALSHSLDIKFTIQSQVDHQFGALQPDGNYSGMLGAVHRKEVDIGGPFVASEQRAAVADFTNCLEFSKLGMLTGIMSTERNMFLYFKVFSWQVWLLLFVTIVIGALISILIYDVSLNGWKDNQLLLLSRYLWVFWCYLIGHDCGTTNHWALRNIWFRNSFRVLLAAWLLGPVINSLYTFQGTITSTFAITKLRPVVSSLEELDRKTWVIPVTTKGSAVQICFMTSQEYANLWKRMQNNSIIFSAKTVDETLLKVEKGTHVLIVDYIYALNIASNWVKRTGRCKVQVEEVLFCQNFIALALRKGFNEKDMKRINLRLTYILQAKLTDHWLNRVYTNYTHCSKQPSEGTKPLNITDILGGFVLWGIGIASSILLLFAEVMSSRKEKKAQINKYLSSSNASSAVKSSSTAQLTELKNAPQVGDDEIIVENE
ncbi:probable glutamate receptor [Stegodyphus dumicola]|uniref:probable glutamate receptor n=1 Tax=Stegodyphus dumicola TaxID=202533 RepID=UPI0015AA4B8C|nr:probable glutamate receptor [Stegodyphus dumicola]